MFDQELLEKLPNDPEDAFGIFEMEMRKKIPPVREVSEYEDQRAYDLERSQMAKQYILAIAAFVETHEFDIGIDFDELMRLDGNYFDNKFSVASSKIQFFSNKCAIKLSQRKKAGTACIYVLEAKSKLKIQQYITKIREIILEGDLTDNKKDALLNKLNAFSIEVDKDRTRVESWASFYIMAKTEAKDLTNLSEVSEKVWSAVSKGKELWKALPSIKITAHLNPPQDKIEDHSNSDKQFDLDDEIPF